MSEKDASVFIRKICTEKQDENILKVEKANSKKRDWM